MIAMRLLKLELELKFSKKKLKLYKKTILIHGRTN